MIFAVDSIVIKSTAAAILAVDNIWKAVQHVLCASVGKHCLLVDARPNADSITESAYAGNVKVSQSVITLDHFSSLLKGRLLVVHRKIGKGNGAIRIANSHQAVKRRRRWGLYEQFGVFLEAAQAQNYAYQQAENIALPVLNNGPRDRRNESAQRIFQPQIQYANQIF